MPGPSQKRTDAGPMDDLGLIAEGARKLLMRGVSTVKRTIDPNNQLRSLVKGRYNKMIDSGLSEKEAMEATLAATRAILEEAMEEAIVERRKEEERAKNGGGDEK